MKRKTAERELKVLMNDLDLFSYKFRDRGYLSCPNCHKHLITCPFCRKDMLLHKAASYPDYLASVDPIFIEVKWGKDRYKFDDISAIQRSTLGDNANSWVFAVIGEGRAPKGRAAFLVQWSEHARAETYCVANEYKSLILEKTSRSRVPGVHEFWGAYELDWRDGKWTIPLHHVWWKVNNSIGISEDDMERL